MLSLVGELMRKRFLIAIFLFLAFHAIAQKETSHWFLNGSHVLVTPSGISNTNPTGTSGLFHPINRTTSVSDPAGNLLFAADGNTIIDKNLSEMPSVKGKAMGGGRKILAIQIPNSNKYYLFYTHADYSISGALSCTLTYALIDLSLNNGAGDVTEIRMLDTVLSEAFTLVQSPTSGDAWLVTHKLGTTKFLSYQITATGINSVPVTSNAGTVALIFDYAFVDLKTSPDGKMIGGYCYRVHPGFFAETYQFAEVFNFDFATGVVSNRVRSFRRSGYFFNNFSVEFSPDNRLFYVCVVQRISGLQIFNWADGRVFQYNLCYSDSTDFDNYSMTVAHDFRPNAPSLSWGKVQLGADKQFYMPFSGTTISGFNYPNRIGSYSGYQFNVHQVEVNNYSTVATPDFTHRLLEKAVKNNIVYSGGCFPNPLRFKITNDTIANIVWDFGDAASTSNTSNFTAPQHVFSAPGFYTVKADLYSNAGQLIEKLSELVEIKDPANRLLADYPKDTSFCEGGRLTLKLRIVNGVFRWTMRGIYRPDIYRIHTADTVDITSSGTYFVEMRQDDCDGCTLIDSIQVNVLPKANVVLYDQNLCTGDSLRLQVYDGPDWIWSTGETTSSISVHDGGSYWVRGEYDHNGCPGSDTVVIRSVPGVQFSLPGDTTLCNSNTLLLDPGVSNANYTWQDGTHNSSYTVKLPGNYWVQVTNSNYCRRSDTIRVAYVSAQQVFLGTDTTLCQGDSLVLQTSLPNSQYLWNTGVVSNSITVKQPGIYWLKVNNGSCTVSDTITINFQTPPIVQLGNDTTLCESDKLVLHATAPNASYLWSDGNRSDSIIIRQPGIYSVQLNQNGCIVKDNIDVRYKARPFLWLGRDTAICVGTQLTLNASDPSISKYLWKNGSNQPALTVSAAGNYWISVQGVNGCTNADTLLVNTKSLPVFSLGADTSLCTGEVLSYSFALPGARYLWSDNNQSNSFTINNGGLYWLDVSQDGCNKRDSILVSYKPKPIIWLGNDTTLCEGQTVLLNAFNAGTSYNWSNGAVNSAVTINKPGTYWVRVDLRGCINRDTIQIDYTYLPHFTLGKDTMLCIGQSFLLNPGVGNASYVWQDGSMAASYTVHQPGTYSVIISNSCGSLSDEVIVEKGICNLYMPNAFTPNQDGVNDLFRVKYPGFIDSFSMTIYNRWGEIVFQTKDPAQGWDGKYRGMEQRSDIFIWQIALTTKQGEKMSAKGTVMLIR